MAYDEALAARVRDLLEGEPGITEKRMFGGLAFLVDGHMSVAAGGKGGLMARPGPAAEDGWLDRDGIGPMVMRGRPMTGWLLADSDAVADDDLLGDLVRDAVAHSRTLPPKSSPATGV